MSNVKRIFVEKKPGFDIEAKNKLNDFRETLGVTNLEGLRILVRYDTEGIDLTDFTAATYGIFSEPPIDKIFFDKIALKKDEYAFAVEYLLGQYDARADACAQCISLSNLRESPLVRCAKVYVLKGRLSETDIEKIKNYVINPVDSCESAIKKPQTLAIEFPPPLSTQSMDGFCTMEKPDLHKLMGDLGLAMSCEDILFAQSYFISQEKRDPTITEIRVIDTYWSDHCRHTTFQTHLDEIEFADNPVAQKIQDVYARYKKARKHVYKDKHVPVTLMDMATIHAREALSKDKLPDLDVSDEINACTIKEKVNINGVSEDYLILFKNETHNHPTEIEPFGGAATCLGGAIRDPLSGRAYVYQAMRITGSADPRQEVASTLNNKLPQRKITREAAHGFSSYGNQTGLATGMVDEFYHPGYAAKRLETGAVIAAVPAKNVVRKNPENGDIVVIIGGATGRDGCGGATGSSKAHDETSIVNCGAEVQKGNPITERKLQRLFRIPEFSKKIKRCNDFGAGGVCVAIGELADGLDINLDALPKKYEGLSATELAISESQERMAIVIDLDDFDEIAKLAVRENLEAHIVANVTDTNRMIMNFNGETVLSLSREFLNSGGAKSHASAFVGGADIKNLFSENIYTTAAQTLQALLGDLNIASKKGLAEMFDSTIGALSIYSPFGGKFASTPAQAMAAYVPADGTTTTKTIMAHGFDPYLSQISPFHGAMYSVISSVAKVCAVGGSVVKIYLTLQEYFHKLGADPKRWGVPVSALLGAYHAQRKLKISAIGGKDSMSGSFLDLDVPPTLISFAVCATDNKLISNEFREADSYIQLLFAPTDKLGIVDFDELLEKYEVLEKYVSDGKVLSAHTVERGGVMCAVAKMCFGNGIGARIYSNMNLPSLFSKNYGAIVLETTEHLPEFLNIGNTLPENIISYANERIDLNSMLKTFEQPLINIFPVNIPSTGNILRTKSYCERRPYNKHSAKIAKPRVVLPIFPGTNCEYDTARAFERAGAITLPVIINNLNADYISESLENLSTAIQASQIVVLPGGFSGGDEPDGSGKFIATVFRHPLIEQAISDLLTSRDGLMLGICNGFQALIKLGLIPFGEMREFSETSPTLTYNTIGRHVSSMVKTKVISVKSPWFNLSNAGDIHSLPVSHGEGRLIAPPDIIKALFLNGQVATQYVDLLGNPTMDMPYNPNGSVEAIEGLLSPNGRVLGKMAHTERYAPGLYINSPGNHHQPIIESGVNYFL